MTAQQTLLIVDDEQNVTEALRRILRKMGLRQLVAHSGTEALELLQQEHVDVLISDIDMPGMSGLELLQAVRTQWPEVVRIVLTGGTRLETAVTAINDGEVHRYLTKPWNNEQLVDTIRSTLARLSELRAPVQAEAAARAQEAMKAELEREFPDISRVEREGDAYVLDDVRLGGLVHGLPALLKERLDARVLALPPPPPESTEPHGGDTTQLHDRSLPPVPRGK